jgi:hypothetical protein
MQQPPLLPAETLVRVLRLAKLDGMSVLLIAGVFALLAATAGDFPGAIVGLLAAGAGAVELHGVSLIEERESRGIDWLIGSQLFLLLSILAYCAVRMAHLELPPVPEMFVPVIEASAQQLGMTREEYMTFVQRLGLQVVAIVSIFYQGGMALYYYRRRDPVIRALAEE